MQAALGSPLRLFMLGQVLWKKLFMQRRSSMATVESSNDFGSHKLQSLTARVGKARKGTGPRTELGKERSKRNARTHGIFSNVAVLESESQAEFDALLNGLRKDFQPVGTLEDGLVEVLADTWWHRRRLLIAERAEIEANRQFYEWDEQQRQLQEVGTLPAVSSNGGLIRRIANPEVLETCLARLRVLKIGIETNGFNRDKDRSILTQLYGQFDEGHWQTDLFHTYQVFAGNASLPEATRKQFELPSPKESVDHFLAALIQEIARLRAYDIARATVEQERRKVELRRRSVLDSPRLDQLLRYATTLNRQFERTLSQLERVQRMRLGQPVAPPIDVNVSSS
jgi:hypothetical protein